VGIPTFENPNGRMMEAAKGASISDVRVRNGKRESIFRSYVYPYMDRPNLTVLSHALVTRLTFQGKRVTGVEIAYRDAIYRIGAAVEVVLSLGAIHTPKVLMQSGIGDEASCGDLEFLSCSTFPVWGKIFKTTLHLIVSGNMKPLSNPETTSPRQSFSRRASPGLTVQTYLSVRLRCQKLLLRMPSGLGCLVQAGRYLGRSRTPKAEAVCA
jgi:hypothetical protein